MILTGLEKGIENKNVNLIAINNEIIDRIYREMGKDKIFKEYIKYIEEFAIASNLDIVISLKKGSVSSLWENFIYDNSYEDLVWDKIWGLLKKLQDVESINVQIPIIYKSLNKFEVWNYIIRILTDKVIEIIFDFARENIDKDLTKEDIIKYIFNQNDNTVIISSDTKTKDIILWIQNCIENNNKKRRNNVVAWTLLWIINRDFKWIIDDIYEEYKESKEKSCFIVSFCDDEKIGWKFILKDTLITKLVLDPELSDEIKQDFKNKKYSNYLKWYPIFSTSGKVIIKPVTAVMDIGIFYSKFNKLIDLLNSLK